MKKLDIFKEGEPVLLAPKLSKSVYLRAGLLLLLALFLFNLGQALHIGVIGVIVSVRATFILIKRYFDNRHYYFNVTQHRVIIQTGIFNISRMALPTQGTRFYVKQTFFQKLFNYGSIYILNNLGVRQLVKNISDPIEARDQFNQIKKGL